MEFVGLSGLNDVVDVSRCDAKSVTLSGRDEKVVNSSVPEGATGRFESAYQDVSYVAVFAWRARCLRHITGCLAAALELIFTGTALFRVL
jgi:hypothetical protein